MQAESVIGRGMLYLGPAGCELRHGEGGNGAGVGVCWR